MSAPADTVGVLLAGGLARRMGGGDKPLRVLGGRPILDHVIARAQPQVADLLLNINGDPARFEAYGLPTAGDVIEGHAGPLAGVLTGMEWARAEHPGARWLASFATDAPFFPETLVARLHAALKVDGADMACAMSGGRTHPVFALWPVALADDLRAVMVGEDMRKIDAWTARYRIVHVDFPIVPFDPFFNINKPENLAEAETLMAEVAR
ncbi:MAG: molybdenum cofactor guanylyltransferase MobA [Rhodospirillales bacterium CG15_BIG_FIL_POST_REV_8_21_14_020_66_15]|nr:MAG: molybdenum cofactor guanylyltransferase MobA [Rhodospirillales bacterium CG15_BIG_FIL_POST_REV_8_21_14_020_66_15]